MKRLVATLALTALLLTGCGEGQTLGDPKPPADITGDLVRVEGETDDSYTFKKVTINGMDCIILSSETTYSHEVITFDCDWHSGDEG